MKINVFKTQCTKDTEVFSNTACEKGKVIKKSIDGSKALVKFENGNIYWEEYYNLELL